MGVTGLWDIIAPAGKSRSLTHLTVVDGFEKNPSQKRAYRIGIDASLWFKHAYWSKEGENPQLRLLFFRVVKIAKLPLIPLFVLDGRSRPKLKRGSKMGKSGSHPLSKDFKVLLDAFGMEWREASGEAEAELAYLNRVGAIDAIMTDDADALLFGANTLIRNTSLTLTGNKAQPALNMDGKPSDAHVMIFTADEVRKNDNVGLSQGGMILFALLTGGDYDSGVDKLGKQTAHALGRCGFGDELLEAVKRREVQSLHAFLPTWRQRMNTELRENGKGFMQRCRPGLTIPDNFPRLELLDKYVDPVIRTGGASIRGNGEINLPQIAAFCEKYFEWGNRTTILKRFRSFLWEPCILRVLRRAALDQDKKEIDARISFGITDVHITGVDRPDASDAIGTSITLMSKYLNFSASDRRSEAFVNRGNAVPSNDPRSFVLAICSDRQHVSTDKILEYRLELDPTALVQLTNSGIKGTRPDTAALRNADKDDQDGGDSEDGDSSPRKRRPKKDEQPSDPFRMWCPASMLERVDPQLVKNFELAIQEKTAKKDRRKTGGGSPLSAKKKGKRKAICSDIEPHMNQADSSPSVSPPKKRKGAHKQASTSSDAIYLSRLPSVPQTDPSASAEPLTPTVVSTGDIVFETARSTQVLPSRKQSSQARTRERSPVPAGRRPPVYCFQMGDPCDPDLIEREDLRMGSSPRNDTEWGLSSWADVSSDIEQPDIEEDAAIYSDEALDRFHQRKFMKKAQSSRFVTNSTTKGKERSITVPRPKPSMPKIAEWSEPMPRRVASSRPSGLELDKQHAQSSIPPSTQPRAAENLPLFLPLESRKLPKAKIPVKKGRKSAPARVIDLSSSDEDLDLISSQRSISSSLAKSASQTSSQASLQTRLSSPSMLPPSSQSSAYEACEFDPW